MCVCSKQGEDGGGEPKGVGGPWGAALKVDRLQGFSGSGSKIAGIAGCWLQARSKDARYNPEVARLQLVSCKAARLQGCKLQGCELHPARLQAAGLEGASLQAGPRLHTLDCPRQAVWNSRVLSRLAREGCYTHCGRCCREESLANEPECTISFAAGPGAPIWPTPWGNLPFRGLPFFSEPWARSS